MTSTAPTTMTTTSLSTTTTMTTTSFTGKIMFIINTTETIT